MTCVRSWRNWRDERKKMQRTMDEAHLAAIETTSMDRRRKASTPSVRRTDHYEGLIANWLFFNGGKV